MSSNRVRQICPILFIACAIFIFMVGETVNSSDFPVECLYDSVSVKIESDYTATIEYRLQFKYNTSINDQYSSIKIPENKYLKDEQIDITTILPDGRQIALSEGDIQSISDFGPQYYPDSKTKIVPIPFTFAGAIATIRYKLKSECLLYLPQFFRQRDIPTSNSYLKVVSAIPYRFFAGANEFEITEGISTSEFWAAEIPALRNEINMPPTNNFRIVIRPDTLLYEKDKYGMITWEDVAAFYSTISYNGEMEADLIKTLAVDLCRNQTSFQDTLQAFYNFIRENIRYISADIGRGDFRPLPPNDVIAKKFGDCKDQASLLVSLCRAVGIEAYPSLLATRDKPDFILDLPWPGYFNHQPTCCFDRLPFISRNRLALVCRDDLQAALVPTSQKDDGNLIEVNMTYSISQNGEVRCNVRLSLYNDAAFARYADSPDMILANVFKEFIDVSPANQFVRSFRVEQSSPDKIIISGDFFDRLLASPKDNSLFLKLTSLSMNHLQKQFPLIDRYYPCEFDFPYRLKENITLKLPDGYIARPDSLLYDYNQLQLQMHRSLLCGNHTCRIYSYFQLDDYAILPDSYNEFSGFFKTVMQVAPNILEIVRENNGINKRTP
jgi:hypothetical protein